MENKEQQILAEIKSMMATLRQQMEILDAKMAQLQQLTQTADDEFAPIVLDIDSFEISVEDSLEEQVSEPASAPVTEDVQEQAAEVESAPEPAPEEVSDDLPFELQSEEYSEEFAEVSEEEQSEIPAVEEHAEELVEVPVEESEEEQGEIVLDDVQGAATAESVDDMPVEILLDNPVEKSVEEAVEEPVEDLPEVLSEPEEKPVVKEAIIDVMTERQAWRTDMPGTPVKDVRLAISLHERVLFINHLFSEDPMAFQAAVNRVNASESLEQVVDFVKETYPQWNLDSDLVYRFMMAVRRKIRS